MNYFYEEKNGKHAFVSVYERPEIKRNQQEQYDSLEIGKPLLIQYLRFHFNKPLELSEFKNEVIVTTQIKTEPTKMPAPEMVNYYNPNVIAMDGILNVDNIGGDKYGHELCYYDPSYKGQNIRMTVKALELDKFQVKDQNVIKQSISKFTSLPYLSTLKVPDNILEHGLEIAGMVYNSLNKDDVLFAPHDMDLFYNHINRPHLRSGRYLLIKDPIDIEKYHLDVENRLCLGDKIVSDFTYIVLQVNNHTMDAYKEFDLFQESSKFLELMNRDYGIETYIDNLTKMVSDYKDIDMMMKAKKILSKYKHDGVLNKPEAKEDRQLLLAYINSMSTEMKSMFEETLEILKEV